MTDHERTFDDYMKGREAYRAGQFRVNCPYTHGHRSYQAWVDGYSDAEHEAQIAQHAQQKHSEPIASVTTLEDRLAALEARCVALEALVRRGTGPVKVSCRTNIDQFRGVRWPDSLMCVPQIGDRIDGTGWSDNKVIASLRVCMITHCRDRNGEPYLSIELHR